MLSLKVMRVTLFLMQTRADPHLFTEKYVLCPFYSPLLYVCMLVCVYRYSATSRGVSEQSLPKGNCRSLAEIQFERTQAGVERHFAHLVSTVSKQ